ncbi:FxLD family lantipeptide [Streptomyces sp. MP131-18]|uniref:FxLD family lantipeptide n=1 Tax=Streptomyces sp. MP131-18 TaxID=1857892 RepID=UPI0009D26387|nr:FxLD family lantipeptide [Streptomyces sp. MP131-18]ONK13301.1 hypothetical protein STBA_40640 [Streptomyces sp. MP131-18]
MDALITDDVEFDLDVSFIASEPDEEEKNPDTDDNCGGPQDSAGTTCPSAG